MHCEIINRYFNVFFVEIQLKKENLKNVFRAPKPVYRILKQPGCVTDRFPIIRAVVYFNDPNIFIQSNICR